MDQPLCAQPLPGVQPLATTVESLPNATQLLHNCFTQTETRTHPPLHPTILDLGTTLMQCVSPTITRLPNEHTIALVAYTYISLARFPRTVRELEESLLRASD